LREAGADKSADIAYIINLMDSTARNALPGDHDKAFCRMVAASASSQLFMNFTDPV